jgi:hypothetical protein
MNLSIVMTVFAFCVVCRAQASETGGANDITAVSGRTSKDYVRLRLSNGSFAPESYVFGNGGVWSGAMPDMSMDRMTFLDVAHMIAYPLAEQNYLPARAPKANKLLIMVYWGTTHAPVQAKDSPLYLNLQNATDELKVDAMERYADEKGNIKREVLLHDIMLTALVSAGIENDQRMKEDGLNAQMLGYDSWWESTQYSAARGFGLDFRRKDMIDELEQNRYFVVLMAYDFQLLLKEKKHKLLWETRFSIRQRHHNFDTDLPTMVKFASQYFGQDTKGLVHKAVPFGHVDIGEVKSLGEVPAK